MAISIARHQKTGSDGLIRIADSDSERASQALATRSAPARSGGSQKGTVVPGFRNRRRTASFAAGVNDKLVYSTRTGQLAGRWNAASYRSHVNGAHSAKVLRKRLRIL